MVVAPSRRLQYAAKSCSPTSPRAASFIASTSSGQSCQRTCPRSSGSTPPGWSVTRYAYRRQIAEKRALNPAGASSARHTRTSFGSRPASRFSSFSRCSSHTPAAMSTCATWPRACTPASVRPATVSSYERSPERVTVRSASSISPCTVRHFGLLGPAGEVRTVVAQVQPHPDETGLHLVAHTLILPAHRVTDV